MGSKEKFVLVMTACISPKILNDSLKRIDTEDRLNDYKSSLRLWLNHKDDRIYGIAFVEALACGTPVAITTKVNIYEEIQNADAGLIFEDTKASTTDCLKNIAAISEDLLYLLFDFVLEDLLFLIHQDTFH
jgi:glycosyltransferase involved in cell wall biosynthesis